MVLSFWCNTLIFKPRQRWINTYYLSNTSLLTEGNFKKELRSIIICETHYQVIEVTDSLSSWRRFRFMISSAAPSLPGQMNRLDFCRTKKPSFHCCGSSMALYRSTPTRSNSRASRQWQLRGVVACQRLKQSRALVHWCEKLFPVCREHSPTDSYLPSRSLSPNCATHPESPGQTGPVYQTWGKARKWIEIWNEQKE